MILFVIILISPVHSVNGDDDSLKEIYVNDMNINDFSRLEYVYAEVYSDENHDEIESRMNNAFKNGDLDNDGILSFDEFNQAFRIIYKYYSEMKNPYNEDSDYDFFKQTDSNADGRIDFDEFSQISYIFTEDSYWDGYSIEEICHSEFERADDNANDYLNYFEFKQVI